MGLEAPPPPSPPQMSAPHHTTPHNNAAWNMLRRAETHDPHPPISMITLVDRGPIIMHGCVLDKCGNTRTHYGAWDNGPAPVCRGGFAWSFSTTTKFDAEEAGG